MTAYFTIFVCSTFNDLSQEREGVLDAIRRLKLKHDSMEFFGARAEQPIETCLQEVQVSDVLVVIVGHQYGSIVPELGISYSEAEYSEGFRLKKPCLVYIRDDSVPILPKHMERDPEKLKLLESWKKTLQSRHTVAKFQDGNSLAVQVTADLARTIQATVRTEGGMPLLGIPARPEADVTSRLGQMREAGYAWLTVVEDSLGNRNENSWGKDQGGGWSHATDTTVRVGDNIRLLARAVSPRDDSLEFHFALQPAGGTFQVRQDWSPVSEWSWVVAPEDIGRNINIKIAVRQPKDFYQFGDADDYTYATYDVLPSLQPD